MRDEPGGHSGNPKLAVRRSVHTFTMKRFTTVACLAAALGISAVLVLRQPAPQARPSHAEEASLLFVGFTNVPAKGTHAMFCLTNSTRAHLVCVPDSVEQATAGVWVRTALTGKASRAVRHWVGLKEELFPGEAFTFSVPPPTTNVAWRLVFLCQERARVVDGASDLLRHVTDTNAAAHQDRRFSGRRYFVMTPEVTR